MTPAGDAAAPDDRLVWHDLEMTGLDVSRHVIVEIAVLVTNDQLEPLDDGIDIVVHQPAAALAEMDDFVRTMHTKSGLLPAIEASPVTLADEGAVVLEQAEPVCSVELPLPFPRATPRPKRLTVLHRIRRVRLGQRLPRFHPIAAAQPDRAPGVVVADIKRSQHHARAGKRGVATALHDRHRRDLTARYRSMPGSVTP